MGSTQYDDGMEHAWSPTRSAAGRRLRPITGTEAPSCGGGVECAVGGRFLGARAGSSQAPSDGVVKD